MRSSRIVSISSIILGLIIINNTLCFSENISLRVIPQHDDWVYDIGDKVTFNISISGNVELPLFVSYEIGPEKMLLVKEHSFKTDRKEFVLDGGTMEIPGFLRCVVTIHSGDLVFTEFATVAFQPDSIAPTIGYPDDFLKFWNEIVTQARNIPLDTQMKLIKEKCTDRYNVYEVNYLNYEYSNRSYGILTIPVKKGKYPAIIRFPGAGVHPLGGNTTIADRDVITLDIYIHPFSMLWDRKFYDELKNSSYIEYKFWGSSSRDAYYYKRVITGCIKAVDLIFELANFDGENLAAWGSSQGGALSIITSSLDKRIKMLVALCPAMCDHTGYLYGRAGGWPHFLNEDNIEKYNNDDTMNTLPYYDVVNFARNIVIPGFYSWGFNDEITPPTSLYSAYNVIKAPKNILVIPEGTHRIYPEQVEKTYNWIFDLFEQTK